MRFFFMTRICSLKFVGISTRPAKSIVEIIQDRYVFICYYYAYIVLRPDLTGQFHSARAQIQTAAREKFWDRVKTEYRSVSERIFPPP